MSKELKAIVTDTIIVVCTIFIILSSFMFDVKAGFFEGSEELKPLVVEAEPISSYIEEPSKNINTINVIRQETNIVVEQTVPETDILDTLSEEELYFLAECVEIEAEGEGLEGKEAVARVLINRVNSEEFPNTFKEVVSQKLGKYYQFSSYRSKKWGTKEITEETYDAVRNALNGSDIVGESTYFCNLNLIKGGWFINKIEDGTLIEYIVIGNHTFFITK